MKAKPPSSFTFKLHRPCRKLFLKLLRFPFARQICVKPFNFLFKRRRTTARNRTRFLSLRAALGLRRVTQDMETLSEEKSSGERCRAPFSSPLTPSYVKLAAAARGCVEEEVEEACRSFERHLVEMIVEEGELGDLMDVEELLHCWNSLKSTVFIELVSSFYGEICRDLFSGREENKKRKVDDD